MLISRSPNFGRIQSFLGQAPEQRYQLEAAGENMAGRFTVTAPNLAGESTKRDGAQLGISDIQVVGFHSVSLYIHPIKLVTLF